MENQETKNQRTFIGDVVSDKMDKTIVVSVTQEFRHEIYKKRMTTSKKYKVHDEKNEAKVGQKVKFAECRPLSKDKRWRLLEIIG